MVHSITRRWSVMPQRYIGSTKMPNATYVVPMTPAASAAQVAMMQNKHRLMSHANSTEDNEDHLEDHLEDINRKSDNALEQVEKTKKIMYMNQGFILLLIACFIILYLSLID